MTKKYFEIRDNSAFIPVVAVDLHPTTDNETIKPIEQALVSASAYNPITTILLTTLSSELRTEHDPSNWHNRTLETAHHYILSYWEGLDSGQVINVEFIEGDSANPEAHVHLEL